MMDDEEDGALMSFPPRSSSPLPISTGPDNEKYIFSPSPSPSPGVSPLGSAHSSTARLPLVNGCRLDNGKRASAPSSFSVDQHLPHHGLSSENSSCLLELLEWFVLKCCCFCSWNLNPQLKLRKS